MIQDELTMDAFSNSIVSLSCIYALRDVLLITEEQKQLFNLKKDEYVKKFFFEFAQKYDVQNPEELYEKVKSNLPQ